MIGTYREAGLTQPSLRLLLTSQFTSFEYCADSINDRDRRRRRRLVLCPGGGPVELLPGARDRLRGPEGGLGLAPLRDGGAGGRLLAGTAGGQTEFYPEMSKWVAVFIYLIEYSAIWGRA